jgi:tetratricopeptide (TPR) repeat protein
MKTAHVIRDVLQALKDGEQQFKQCNYEGAVDLYKKALKLSVLLPVTEGFDCQAFEASIHSSLSAAYGQLGKHLESFSAANKALLYYDAHGEKYAEHTGRWLKAIVNQGVALAHLGIFAEAMNSFQRAKELFLSKSLDTPENKQWLTIVDENIAAIKAHLDKKAIDSTSTAPT